MCVLYKNIQDIYTIYMYFVSCYTVFIIYSYGVRKNKHKSQIYAAKKSPRCIRMSAIQSHVVCVLRMHNTKQLDGHSCNTATVARGQGNRPVLAAWKVRPLQGGNPAPNSSQACTAARDQDMINQPPFHTWYNRSGPKNKAAMVEVWIRQQIFRLLGQLRMNISGFYVFFL